MATKTVAKKPAPKAVTRPAPKAPVATSSHPGGVGRAATAAAPARAKVVPAPEVETLLEEVEVVEEVVTDPEYVEALEEVLNEALAESGDEILDLSTEELEDPRSPKADALRVRCDGIEVFHSERTGSPAIRILMTCDDLNKSLKQDVYVPKEFEADIRVNPKELSSKDPNTQAQYAIAIHNKRNEAIVDRLRVIAKGQGRQFPEGQETPQTFEDFVQLLNYLVGPQDGESVQFLITRRPNRDNGFLEIQKYWEIELIETKPELFKNYRKSWEVGE